MLNTAIVIGISREFFEYELKLLTQTEFKNSKFKNAQEAYDSSLDYFFMNYENLHRSDSNSNSCIVIKEMEEKNKFNIDEVQFTKTDFKTFLLECNNFTNDTSWFSKIISQAFKNLAQKVTFPDVKIFVMNYS